MIDKSSKSPETQLAFSIFNATDEAMFLTDANCRITAVNEAFTILTGYEPAEIIGKKPENLLAGEHDLGFFDDILKILERKDKWQGKMWNRHKTGSLILVNAKMIILKNAEGNISNYLGFYGRKFDKKTYKGNVVYDAFTDALTGTASKSLLLDRLHQVIMRSERYCAGFALIFLNLSNLGKVNNSLGFIPGDEILKRTAELLLSCSRESDIVSRWGGNEFVLAAVDTHNENNTNVLLNRITDLFKKENEAREAIGDIPIEINLGVAMYPANASEALALVERAKSAALAALSSDKQIMFAG